MKKVTNKVKKVIKKVKKPKDPFVGIENEDLLGDYFMYYEERVYLNLVSPFIENEDRILELDEKMAELEDEILRRMENNKEE